jgi:broad specificity phosphatase PhoE
MLRLYLLAHASTPAQRRFQFPADEGIEPVEPERARRLARRLERCRAAWRGPERRAAETAAALGLSATSADELRAWSAGRWAGQSIASVAERDPEGFRAWRTDPDAAPSGGESLRALLERVARWMTAQSRDAGRVLVIADPAVIRAAMVYALDAGPATFWRLDVGPLSLAIVQRSGDEWRLRGLEIQSEEIPAR